MRFLAAALTLTSGLMGCTRDPVATQPAGGVGAGGDASGSTGAADASASPGDGGGGAGAYRPPSTVTWQWQLAGTLNVSYAVDLYDIDLFDTAPTAIAALQSAGKRVICYFSAGTGENWRDDFSGFAASDLGKALPDYPNERWLDIRSDSVRRVMADRLDLARQKGCDAVEPDNVAAYQEDTGLPLTAGDQLAFNRWVAQEAHARHLGVGLKNDSDQIAALEPHFDFAIYEQCHEYDECDRVKPFTAAGKAVLSAEYAENETAAQETATVICPKARALGLRTLILPRDLNDAFRVSCDP